MNQSFSNPLSSLTEPKWIRRGLIGIVVLFVLTFLVIPLVALFYEAFGKGLPFYLRSIFNPMAWSAIQLTILVTLVVVPLNTLFGLAAAWSISRFRFIGKTILITVIDLPFTVSPVIAGMLFVLLFGSRGLLGPWFLDHGVRIIFSVPGIILATWFVTFPFVARELIPLLQAQGQDEELAALVLGGNAWQIFWRITLPNIKWGLLYGIILCSARAMGEFGAVSVVSGHIRGQTNTIPLHIEILYNEYQFTAAFAVASLLVSLSLVTLLIKSIMRQKYQTHQMENHEY